MSDDLLMRIAQLRYQCRQMHGTSQRLANEYPEHDVFRRVGERFKQIDLLLTRALAPKGPTP